MGKFIYKLFRASEWEAAKKTGTFEGSSDDRRDRFLHFSSSHQVRATYDKHFAGENNLILAAVAMDRLGDSLKWEASRRGESFPHLYGALKLADIDSVFEIRPGPDGRPIFPLEIP